MDNNEDMLITPENVEQNNNLNNNANIQPENNVINQNINNSLMGALNNTMNQTGVQEPVVENIPSVNDSVNNSSVDNWMNSFDSSKPLEQLVVNDDISSNTNINNSNIINQESTEVTPVNTDNISSNDNSNYNHQEINTPEINKEEDIMSDSPQYYQEGQVNINEEKSKIEFLTGTGGALIILLATIAQYFLLTPYIERFLLKRSFYEMYDAVYEALASNGGQFHEFMTYVYTFAFIAVATLSLGLIVYALINLIKRGDCIHNIKTHLSRMIILDIIFSAGCVILLRFFNIDIITNVTRVITIDGNQFKIIGESILF